MKKNLCKYNGLVEKDTIDTLKVAAEQDARTLSSMVNKVLRDFCKEYISDSARHL